MRAHKWFSLSGDFGNGYSAKIVCWRRRCAGRVFDTQLYFPDELIDELYANVEPYRSHTVISVPGSDQQITRLRNSDDDGYRWSESVPMTIEQVNGDLVASAAIGTWGTANRGIPSFHGR